MAIHEKTVLMLGGDPVAAGVQQAHVADVAITATLTGVDTGTEMTAAQAATIIADLTRFETAVNGILASLEEFGIHAGS